MRLLTISMLCFLTFVELSSGRSTGSSEDYADDGGMKFGAGYKRPVPSTDETVHFMAEWAADKLHGKLVQVNTAEEQVVQGMMFYINFTMDDEHKKKRVCYVKIWSRAWLNSTKLLHHKCA